MGTQPQGQQKKQQPKRVIGISATSGTPKISNDCFVFVIAAVFSENGKPLVHANVQLKKNQNVIGSRLTDANGKVTFTVHEPSTSSGNSIIYELSTKLNDGTEGKQSITVTFPELPSYALQARGKYCPRCHSPNYTISTIGNCRDCNYPGPTKY